MLEGVTTLTITQEATYASNIALAVSTENSVTAPGADAEFVTAVETALTTLGFTASSGSTTKIVNPLDPSKVVIAVGVADDHATDSLREMAGAAVRASAGLPDLTIAFDHDSAEQLSAIKEGVLLGAYVFDRYKEIKDRAAEDVTIVSSAANSDRAEILATAVNEVRDLVNTTPNFLNPVSFAQIALDQAQAAGVEVKVYDEKALEAEKLNGILQVGKGSASAPRLVRVEWNPADASGFTALVGKGITFDTGGYSLKPSTAITEMKTDMAGAATVLHTVIAAAKLGIKRRVVGWLCLAENMISGTAGRPDDVITYRNGISVEINNTDAEGRLVMADGLIMGAEENPDEIIDIATLTGAQMVALGQRTTGIMGDDEVRDGLVAAAQSAGEAAWPMPLPKELRKSLDSDVADMTNTGSRYGGMLAAGIFLKEFVGDTPWAHIDIAGPSFNRESAYGYMPKGATGVMLRTLIAHLER